MSKVSISKIEAYEVFDSRGNPTVAAEVLLSDGTSSISYVPSGASVGKHEAKEKRDLENNRFEGKGVIKAISSINEDINSILQKHDVFDQAAIDHLMCKEDGTKDKSNLGANAILGVSMACAKSAAKSLNHPLYTYFHSKMIEMQGQSEEQSLPIPMLNLINGGVHSDNSLDFQEFMIQPIKFESFKRALQCGVEVFHKLKELLKKNNLSTSVGDEGGFSPQINSTEEALKILIKAVEDSGYLPGKQVFLALDVASSELFDNGNYRLEGINEKFSTTEFIDYLTELRNKYPIFSIEDGLDEDDWKGWKKLTDKLGENTQLVGDDLFATNKHRLKKGIKSGVANAVLIKINQIGTLSETLEAIKLAKDNSYSTIISHRSGDTEDTAISDLAVAVGAGQIKIGAPSRSERVAKYNRLLIIEEKSGLRFLGKDEL